MYIVPSSVTTTTSKNPKSPRAWVVKFLMLATSLAFKVNYEDAAVPSLYNNESSSHTKLTQWSKLYIPSTVRNMPTLWQITLWEENRDVISICSTLCGFRFLSTPSHLSFVPFLLWPTKFLLLGTNIDRNPHRVAMNNLNIAFFFFPQLKSNFTKKTRLWRKHMKFSHFYVEIVLTGKMKKKKTLKSRIL